MSALCALTLAVAACEEEGPQYATERGVSAQRAARATSGAPSKRPARPALETPEDAVPGAVIVRTVHGTADPVTARCGRTERLLSGGCSGQIGDGMMGFPTGYSATDTRGAAWICDAPGSWSSTSITAYAMCQVVEAPSEPEPASGPDADPQASL